MTGIGTMYAVQGVALLGALATWAAVFAVQIVRGCLLR